MIFWLRDTDGGLAPRCKGCPGREPLRPAERSLAERWMDWSQASLQTDFLLGVFWGFYRTPEAQRNMPAVNAKMGSGAGASSPGAES